MQIEDMFPVYQTYRRDIDEICGDCEPVMFFNINMGYYYLMKISGPK